MKHSARICAASLALTVAALTATPQRTYAQSGECCCTMQVLGGFDLCLNDGVIAPLIDCTDLCNIVVGGDPGIPVFFCELQMAYEAGSLCETPLPAQVTGISATVTGKDVALSWTTVSETNNAGFEVQGQSAKVEGQRWEYLGFVGGAGTTTTPNNYTYRASDIEPGTWNLRLKQIDFDGSFVYSGTVEVTVTVPDQFVLEAAYPNPFNPTTTIRFAVPVEQAVILTLNDNQGRIVRKLWQGTAAANEMYSVRVSSEGLTSGVYVARLAGEGFEASESVTLVR